MLKNLATSLTFTVIEKKLFCPWNSKAVFVLSVAGINYWGYTRGCLDGIEEESGKRKTKVNKRNFSFALVSCSTLQFELRAGLTSRFRNPIFTRGDGISFHPILFSEWNFLRVASRNIIWHLRNLLKWLPRYNDNDLFFFCPHWKINSKFREWRWELWNYADFHDKAIFFTLTWFNLLAVTSI